MSSLVSGVRCELRYPREELQACDRFRKEHCGCQRTVFCRFRRDTAALCSSTSPRPRKNLRMRCYSSHPSLSPYNLLTPIRHQIILQTKVAASFEFGALNGDRCGCPYGPREVRSCLSLDERLRHTQPSSFFRSTRGPCALAGT